MHSFILLLSLLTTLALAAPHAIHHQFLHTNRDLTSPIAGRSISDIGLCGGDSGFVCAEGSCCSQWGYCGTSSDYCGAGCQFGNCDAPASSGAGSGSSSANSTSSSSSAATFAPSPTTVFNAPLFSSEVESSTSETSAPVSTSVAAPQPTTMVTLVSSSAAPPSTSVATTSTSVYVAPSPTSETSSSVYVAPSSSSEAPSSTVALGSPSSSPSASGSGQGLGDVYKMYYGDGTASQGWPTLDDWVDFDTMWTNNLQSTISTGCNYYKVPNNSDEENNEIKSAILSTSQSSGVDARYILAIVLQESNGCARVPSSGNGVFNPGLMQDHAGTGTCNGASGILNPCPVSEINQMITEGTAGTSQGPGLLQVLSEAVDTYSANEDSKFFVAARLYNSGQNSITNTEVFNLSAPSDGTLCYAMSVANRLTGWFTGLPGCHS